MAIYFSFQDPSFSKFLTNRRRLKGFIQDQIGIQGRSLGVLSFSFLSDSDLKDMNKAFLNHDYYTDIITFDTSEGGNLVSGDIFISIDRVSENSVEFGEGFQRELHRVIFHGVLHLLGFTDKTKAEKKRMRLAEDSWLSDFGI